jgi:cytochrome c5
MEKSMQHKVRSALLILLMAGCSNNKTTDPALQLCEEPRPEMCTMQYDPVCGQRQDDSRETYSTGCTACSDASVKGWLPGECQ